jgi:hypothetical protein
MRLSQVQQRSLINSLPASRKIAVKKYCRACEQSGDGIKDILKKVGAFLGPIAKEVGPKILKEFIIPLLLKKAQEKYGIDPTGGTLKLAGQGKKTSPWILHVKKVSKEKGISYKEAMKVAKSTYKK